MSQKRNLISDTNPRPKAIETMQAVEVTENSAKKKTRKNKEKEKKKNIKMRMEYTTQIGNHPFIPGNGTHGNTSGGDNLFAPDIAKPKRALEPRA
jgi:hypothetical protein